jgi:diguanylate cyclase (GGDEF)-like protein
MDPEIIRVGLLLLAEADTHTIRNLLAAPINIPGIAPVKYVFTETRDQNEARRWLHQNQLDVFLIEHSPIQPTGRTLYEETLGGSILPAAVLLANDDSPGSRIPTNRLGWPNVLMMSQLSSTGLEQAIRYAIDNNALQRKIRKHTIHDPETGVFNRDEFERLLQEEMVRTERYQQDFTVAVIELLGWQSIGPGLDRVKQLQMLQQLGEIMVTNIRVLDRIGRLGDDRFGIILPETDPEGALICLERIRDLVSGVSWQRLAAQPADLTLRAGLIAVPEGAADFNSVLTNLAAFPAAFETETRPGIFL